MSQAIASSPAPIGVTQPIPRALFALALPGLASLLLRLGYQWVDALWVRRLGVEATAAVTTSIFIMWSMYALNDIFAIGVTAYTSQLLGAGERRRAGVAAFKGVRASALLGLVGTTAGIFAARRLYGLMGTDPHTLAAGTAFLSIVLMGVPLAMMALTCESIMRASGDTRTPLLIDLCAVGLNAALDPLLIYGWGPFHGLGVAGAACATVASWAAWLGGYMLMAGLSHPAMPFARRAEGPPVRIAGMARVGLPAALIGILFSVVYIAFARSAGRFGPAALATIGIANRIEAIQFVTSVAIGTAGAALVGQNLGARRPDRAVETIRTGLVWATWMSLAVTAILVVFPGFFLTLFTRDPDVHRIGVPYLRILAVCLVANSWEIVTSESVLGSGHTAMLSFIFSSFSLIRIPLAFWVPDVLHNGALGIAWVISITCILRALVIVVWTARGTWKQGLQRELRGMSELPASEL